MPNTCGQFDAERVCRVCLREVGNFYFIYDEAPVEQGVNIAQILNECTRYTCERYDKMPHHICDTCIKAACQAYRFKQDAEKAYRSLVAILGRTPTSKPNSSDVCTQTERLPMLPCGICNDKFLSIIEVRLHRNRHHKHMGELKCKLCDERFSQLRQLRCHLVERHDPKSTNVDSFLRRRLECPDCQRVFSRRGFLLRHMQNVHKVKCRRRRRRLASGQEVKSNALTWFPIEEATMHSADELISAAVLFDDAATCSDEEDVNEKKLMSHQCHTNPISSNEEADDEDVHEAEQLLWMHIKPESNQDLESRPESFVLPAHSEDERLNNQKTAISVFTAEIKGIIETTTAIMNCLKKMSELEFF